MTLKSNKEKMGFQNISYSRSTVPEPFILGKEPWIELYYFAWECASKHILHYPGIPSPYYMKEGCMDHPNRIYQWDTCFMTMFTKYAPEVFPGIESLDNFYVTQHEDGYISIAHQIDTGEEVYGERINPPLYAWAEWEYFVHTGDASRLERVFPLLVKYFAWIKKNRRREEGIYWFEGTGSSGMDNSPRAYQEGKVGGEIGWIDLTCQQAMAARYLALIAEKLGQEEAAGRFNQEHNQISNVVNQRMWNDRTSFYYDVFPSDGFPESNVVPCMTIAGYWPLLSRIAPEARAKAMVKHLQDKTKFRRLHMVPSLSYSNPNYREDGGYWVGSIWPPTNYMVVRGLTECGFNALATEIAQNHIVNIRKVFDEFSPATIWECYAPDLSEPAKSHRARRNSYVRQDFVGWGGLGPIAMLIENVIGVTLNVPENRLYWRINLCEEHGIKNLKFNNKKVSLRCESRKDHNSPAKLRIKSEIDLTLCVSLNDEMKEFPVIPGRENILSVGLTC